MASGPTTSDGVVRYAWKAMGSPCELALYASRGVDAQVAIRKVVDDVERLEERYSRYRDSSFLARINRVAAEGGGIEIDGETAGLIDYAATCYAQSEGLFDITSGLLRKAWDFKSGRLPERSAIETLLPHVGWDKVRWQRPTLAFPVAGMELDLGGVVKEYAADRAATLCRNFGVASGFVNLGGDIAIVGPRPGGDAWRIGLAHPRETGLLCTVELHSGALASSGDYERCIVIEGKRYGHILNAKTGHPVRHLAAVTVRANLCVVAGSASTIAMLKDEDGPAWLAALDLPHLWVDVNGRMGGPLAA